MQKLGPPISKLNMIYSHNERCSCQKFLKTYLPLTYQNI